MMLFYQSKVIAMIDFNSLIYALKKDSFSSRINLLFNCKEQNYGGLKETVVGTMFIIILLIVNIIIIS